MIYQLYERQFHFIDIVNWRAQYLGHVTWASLDSGNNGTKWGAQGCLLLRMEVVIGATHSKLWLQIDPGESETVKARRLCGASLENIAPRRSAPVGRPSVSTCTDMQRTNWYCEPPPTPPPLKLAYVTRFVELFFSACIIPCRSLCR